MSKSKLINYYAGFATHLKFDEDKENLEKNNSELKPFENLILNDLNKSEEDFNIRNVYLGWMRYIYYII